MIGTPIARAVAVQVLATFIASYSTTGAAAPITLSAGQTLEATFQLDTPYVLPPNLLGFGWNTTYTGNSTTRLYNGPTLLGEYSGTGTAGYFRPANSPAGGTVVDFSSILDRSIQGRIELSIGSGSVQFDPAAAVSDSNGRPAVTTYHYVPFVAFFVQSVSTPNSIQVATPPPPLQISQGTLPSQSLLTAAAYFANRGQPVTTSTPGQPAQTLSGRNLQLYDSQTQQFVPNFAKTQLNAAAPTYVLVHGWRGPGSSLTSVQQDPLADTFSWVAQMASEIKQREPNANVLGWNWTELADSTRLNPIGCFGREAECATLLALGRDWWVPNNLVTMQGRNLASALQTMMGDLSGSPIHFLGHSLGGAVATHATDSLVRLSENGTFAPRLERLTLFDPPERDGSFLVGGNVNLDTVLPAIVSSRFAPAIENHSAFSSVPGVLGYGVPYRNIANNALLGYAHISLTALQPDTQTWYRKTISPEVGSADGVDQARVGRNESAAALAARVDRVYANQTPGRDWFLEDMGTVTAFRSSLINVGSAVLRLGDAVGTPILRVWQSWHDFVNGTIRAGATQFVDWVVTGTRTVARWIGSGIDAVVRVFNNAEVRGVDVNQLLAAGNAAPVPGLGVRLTTGSPTFVFSDLDLPSWAEMLFVEFLPEVWGDGDMFLIGINDQMLYLLDSQHFLGEWMNSGFLDVSRWAGQEVPLSFGLLSESAGHSFTIGGYGLFSRERSVPEPGTLVLTLLSLGFLYSIAQPQKRRRSAVR